MSRRLHAIFRILVKVVDGTCNGQTMFGRYLYKLLDNSGRVSSVRGMDLLPIPAVRPCDDNDANLTVLTNMSLAGFNFLYGGMRDVAVSTVSAQARARRKWW